MTGTLAAAYGRSKDGKARVQHKRGKGRPAMTCDQVINKILTAKGITWTTAKQKALNRKKWKVFKRIVFYFG